MLQGPGAYGDKLDPWELAEKYQCTSVKAAAKFILDLFLQGDLEQDTGTSLLEVVRTTDSAEEVSSAAVLRRLLTRAMFSAVL